MHVQRFCRPTRAAAAAALLLSSQTVMAQQPVDSAVEYLGRVEFAISCGAHVKDDFSRAVALLHHMTYPRARESFERIAAADSTCAMAHWGYAMTLFQPLWPTRPGPEDLKRGWIALQKARSLVPGTERERLFVAAAEAFFEPDELDYWQRIRRWADGTQKLHEALPLDAEATALYGLTVLAGARADTIDTARAERAAALLLSIHERNPDHPGALHYLIHANDVPGREQEQLDLVRKYEQLAPHNPHALHMPTHIYTRLGDWDAVIAGNLRAAEAALEHPAGDAGEFVWDEFPHAIEYLVYAHLQKADDLEAAQQLERLRATSRLEPTFKTAFHVASIPVRIALERRAWDEAAQLVPRQPASLAWERFMWPEAVTWFGRGLGSAHLARPDAAQEASARIAELKAAAFGAGEALFGRHIEIMGLELAGWLAHLRQQKDSSIALMRRAVELESSTPKHAVTPAPMLPALELLGDLYLQQGNTADALAAYRRALEHYPHRFNSLLGAARAARALDDVSLARQFYRELISVAAPGARPVILQEAHTFTR